MTASKLHRLETNDKFRLRTPKSRDSLEDLGVSGRIIHSVETPTRCSFVIEFIIPTFIEGSTFLERHTAHHQEL